MTATSRRATTPDTHDNWQQHGACTSKNAELFFPVAHTYGWRKQTEAAKNVCAGCPVREVCLQWAVETGQQAGVWGGLSERERQALSPERRSPTQVCLDEQMWIERQLAQGRSRKSIARQLGVDSTTLGRMVDRFTEERATALAMEMKGVKA
jgi:WhiB family redox-sensing transcriptional regulator